MFAVYVSYLIRFDNFGGFGSELILLAPACIADMLYRRLCGLSYSFAKRTLPKAVGNGESPLGFVCRRLPIFPAGCPASIFGTSELNFRVRDGNGWILTVIGTGLANCQLTMYN